MECIISGFIGLCLGFFIFSPHAQTKSGYAIYEMRIYRKVKDELFKEVTKDAK